MAFGMARRGWLPRLLGAALLLLCVLGHAAPVGHGYVDRVQVDGRQLTVTGWAASERPEVFITAAIVRLDGRTVYRGRVQRHERPDVAAATGRPDWGGSGISVRLALPRDIGPGPHTLEVEMQRSDGQIFALAIAPSLRQITIPASPKPSPMVLLALLLAVALPLAALVLPSTSAWPRSWPPPLAFVAALPVSFMLLVASGATGSSVALLLRPPAVTVERAEPWLGSPQFVRSDEWEVITPLAMAQATHTPPWPIVNHNLGEDGQNMLVIGMTGMPVAHASTLAKPATWGWFAFDQRRALAWAWWLPVLGGFAACWALLMRLTRLAWRPAAALAAGLAWAPYSAGFSFWPSYLLLFVALGLLAFDRLLHARRAAAGLAWGALLGWSAAAYALVLYPAWQISLAWLCAPLALAWAWRERAHWRWGAAQTLGALAGVLLAGLLLLAWWLDARDAVAVMQGTIYPGQRATEAGGDIDRWFELKGWLNPFTLHVNTPMVSSEAASFQFLWLPTLALVLWRWWQARRIEPVSLALLAFMAFALTFQFIGFAPMLARVTGWGSVTSYRLDLALGTAQLLLIAWWLAPASEPVPLPRPGPAVALALAVLALAGCELSTMPLDIRDGLPAGLVLGSMLAMAACAALLARRQTGAFIALYGGWTLAAVLPFHPLGQAPDRLSLAPPLRAAGLAASSADAAGRRGVAVVGMRDWAMTLPAAGVPVVNSVFYYPQAALWARLDPAGQQRGVYNRYQRLLLELAPLPGDARFIIESPRLDEVRLTLDPARFDFRLLGARHVLAPARDADALGANPTLARQATPGAEATVYALFDVRP